MGLSSKHVISSDGLEVVDWSQTLLQSQTSELQRPDPLAIRRQQQQQNQQQSEPLKCPRCESTNTKFCYYNNYNKLQPRHFCKTCKRHWTKGGSLRNVPVGGGRKKKRLKTSKSTSSNMTNSAAPATTLKAATGTTTTAVRNICTRNIINRVSPQLALQVQQLGVGDCDQKDISNVLFQALNRQPSSSFRQDSISCSYMDSTNSLDGVFTSSAFSLPPNQSLSFPYSISGSFETIPCPIPTSFQPTNVCNYSSGKAMEESTITTFILPSTSSSTTHTWQVSNASNGMDYWSLDDIDNFVSTDLNISWDDPVVKP